jgi:OCT family organic cation transporter-like MFS transporter 4/5
MAGLLFQVPFALGEILIGLAAMAIRDYRWFQTALAIPCIVMLGLYIIIPESPRWLISKKRYKEAKQVIESAAKFNKVGNNYLLFSFYVFALNIKLAIFSFSTVHEVLHSNIVLLCR